METRAHGFLADLEALRYLERRKPFRLAQDERRAVGFGQAIDRRLEELPQLGGVGLLLRAGPLLPGAPGVIVVLVKHGIDPLGARSAPGPSVRLVHGDAREPRREL